MRIQVVSPPICGAGATPCGSRRADRSPTGGISALPRDAGRIAQRAGLLRSHGPAIGSKLAGNIHCLMGIQMQGDTRLLGVADRFFEAAMVPGAWVPALEALVDHLRAEHAMIFARETASAQSILAKSACMGETEFERFLLPEAARWMAPFISRMPSGIAVTSPHGMPDTDFERTELYNEVLRPANGFYSVGVRDELAGTSIFIAVCRPQRKGDFAADDAAALQAILPALSTGLQLHQRLRLAEGRSEALTLALDSLEDGRDPDRRDGPPRNSSMRGPRASWRRPMASTSRRHRSRQRTPIATQRLRAAIAAAAADATIAAQQNSPRPSLTSGAAAAHRVAGLAPRCARARRRCAARRDLHQGDGCPDRHRLRRIA